MAYKSWDETKEPLYFFYDCETTGLEIDKDKIIEIAAVIHTTNLPPRIAQELKRGKADEFTSLVYCERELHQVTQELTGLTLADLRREPRLEVVLNDLFDWINESVTKVSEMDGRSYSPVLAAHSGPRLDYPILFFELKGLRSVSLLHKFQRLNLNYVDTFEVLKDLQISDPSYKELEKLGVHYIYLKYFRTEYEGHRALDDAKALRRIFSEAPPASKIFLFRKYSQSKEGLEMTREQTTKFNTAWISSTKARELLMKGITYERVAEESRRSREAFLCFLKNECCIRKPRQELIQHFILYR